jgi:predicted NACHT family NTPase
VYEILVQDLELRAETAADDLLRRLDGAPGLYALTVNPLLLTMIAIVHRYCGALPGSRADLYGQICQAMLWQRQEARISRSRRLGRRRKPCCAGSPSR